MDGAHQRSYLDFVLLVMQCFCNTLFAYNFDYADVLKLFGVFSLWKIFAHGF